MLLNGKTTTAVVSTLKSHYNDEFPPLIVDPVSVSTSGHTLLDPDAFSVLRQELLPLATIVTPNKSEAEFLLSGDVTICSVKDMLLAAKALASFGSKAVLIKGGHIVTSSSELMDISTPGVAMEWGEGCPGAPDSTLIHEADRHLLKTPHAPNDPFSSLVVDVLQTDMPNEYTLFVRPRV